MRLATLHLRTHFQRAGCDQRLTLVRDRNINIFIRIYESDGLTAMVEITETWSEKNSSVDACSRLSELGGTLDHKLVLFWSLTTSSVVLYIPFLSFFQSYLVDQGIQFQEKRVVEPLLLNHQCVKVQKSDQTGD